MLHHTILLQKEETPAPAEQPEQGGNGHATDNVDNTWPDTDTNDDSGPVSVPDTDDNGSGGNVE